MNLPTGVRAGSLNFTQLNCVLFPFSHFFFSSNAYSICVLYVFVFLITVEIYLFKIDLR